MEDAEWEFRFDYHMLQAFDGQRGLGYCLTQAGSNYWEDVTWIRPPDGPQWLTFLWHIGDDDDNDGIAYSQMPHWFQVVF